MDSNVVVGILAGSITAFGWLVNHILTARRERHKQQTEALLNYVERQLEDLYGPLAFLVYEGRRTFQDLLDTLGRKYIFIENQPLSEKDLKTWLFWVENSFLPLNEKIQKLLMTKTHLIEGSHFPESYLVFLDHHNSWLIQHERWKKENVEYSWHSKVNWPEQFEKDIIKSFELLKTKHSNLLGKLAQI
ncbi:hypothetical protein PCC7424_5181 [Gloeothece citriformis PCC 7424]|uniref:Uncharacterized protein n=1 Tax=Gloeothece citriformis (strain PCC 7424) TaxID=65393 RepID=B7KI44_GLOC7|nr:hypothetical protein [Gloeothece citriformis]ACK73531.1 hypothetical protein PCC7424_5181 [Gloeothece citriformis PCC 7424]